MSYEDKNPLGFTKQTSMILEGLGAGALVNEFEKQNISTDSLKKLTKDDFVLLGASEELAEHMFKRLKTKTIVRSAVDLDNRTRIDELLKVLKSGNEHLYLIKTFLAYGRKRLTMEPIDFIVDPNNNERASRVLSAAVKSTLEDLKQLEYQISSLSLNLKG